MTAVHYGVQKCIDYMRFEKDETFFQCIKCAGKCEVPNVLNCGDCLCENCDDGTAPPNPAIQKILRDIVEYKNKKRKREKL